MDRVFTIYTKVHQEKYKFVSMKTDDIVLNSTIFYLDEEDETMHPVVIDEVMNMNDEFKAFSANGCRYGIDGMYVMRYY